MYNGKNTISRTFDRKTDGSNRKNYSSSRSGGYKKDYRSNNKNYNQKRRPPIKVVDLNTVVKKLTTTLDESIDKENYYYRYQINRRKEATSENDDYGIIGVSVEVYPKTDTNNKRYIHVYFVKNKKVIHTMITDGSLGTANVLFSAFESDPTQKIEKYFPKIVKSLEEKTNKNQ